MFALIDCNNFYASCETVFDPRLKGKPLVILSNNDGCIVARSNEAKKLGIKMGSALFKVAEIVKQHKVIVYSSNYTLYGDMSARVMSTIQSFGIPVEIYSIDEAFLLLKDYSADSLAQLGYQMRARIKKWTGITVSIGIAPTKTLAKIANKVAKKYSVSNGVFVIPNTANTDSILKITPVNDIWGIGRQYTKLLHKHNIFTAFDFKQANEQWVRKKMTVTGLRTLQELRKIPCINLEEVQSKQSIACTRSFGKKVFTLDELKEAVAYYTARAAEKLRKQKSVTSCLYVFIMTSRFCKQKYYNGTISCLPEATNYTPRLIGAALSGLKILYKPGFEYKKAGVILLDISRDVHIQKALFEASVEQLHKQSRVIRTVDNINKKWGKNMIRSAQVPLNAAWTSKKSKYTRRYTTNWKELLLIKI